MASRTRVLLIGCGGVGTIAALCLQNGNLTEVSCVLRSSYATVIERGFEINSCDYGFIRGWRPTELLNAVPYVSKNSDRPFDYIVLSTKNVPDAGLSLCELISPAVSVGHSVIVLIQNGLNIEKPFLAQFPDNIVLSGVSRIDAHEISPGVIEQKDNDNLRIGIFNNPRFDEASQEKAAYLFIEAYNAGGFEGCFYEPHAALDRWCKLVYNATFNPISALTGVNTGDLCLVNGIIDDLLVPAMNEVVRVAETKGCLVPKEIIHDTLHAIDIEQRICTSMQMDVEKGNFIEHEVILGEVIREGRLASVDTPILSTLYSLCSILQARVKRSKGWID